MMTNKLEYSSRGVGGDYNNTNNNKFKSTYSQRTGRSHYHKTHQYRYKHQESSNNTFSALSVLEYLKVSAIVGDLCCHSGDINEPNEVVLPRDTTPKPSLITMPSNKKNSSRSTMTKDWSQWMSSFSFFEPSSNHDQQKQEKPKLPQHQLQHTSSLPTPTRRNGSGRGEEEKQLEPTHFLTRSSSYALKRTGTLNEQELQQRIPCALSCDDSEEEGLEVMMSAARPLSPCWSPPTRVIHVQPQKQKQRGQEPPPKKLTKKVSFASIQIYASTTESLSPSSSLTSSASRDFMEDSPRDPPPLLSMSVDAFEANKPTDLNPVPYHMRFAAPPEIPGKEELRKSDSLLDSGKRKKWRFPKWKKKSTSSYKKHAEHANVPIRVFDATDPKVARHINMAGIVTRSEYTSYEDMY